MPFSIQGSAASPPKIGNKESPCSTTNSLLDALPRPVSLVGSHAYKVIDVPEGRRDFEINFDLAVHPGRTVTVRVVDPTGRVAPGRDGLWVARTEVRLATNAFAATGHSRSTTSTRPGRGGFSSTSLSETSPGSWT